MTIAEQLRQEGMQQGRVDTLRKLLELRFGPLTEITLRRLEAADEATLDRCTERVISADSVDDVFAN